MPPKSQRWWLTTDSQSVDVDAPGIELEGD